METLFSGKLTLPRLSRYDNSAGDPAERAKAVRKDDATAMYREV